MNRREFLKGLGLTTLAVLMPQVLLANRLDFVGERKLLVLIELKGANDGLNTLVPYSNQAYYDARPQIALPPEQLHKLSTTHGMHSGLGSLLPAWEDTDLAWVQGVGYENPNRSHFESIDIWDSAVSDVVNSEDGWISSCFPEHQLGGIAIDASLGPLYGDGFSALSISDPYDFMKQGRKINSVGTAPAVANNSLNHLLKVHSEIDMMADTLADYLSDVPEAKQVFESNSFGRSLNSIYTLIASGVNVPAYKLSLNGFDTHVGQLYTHDNLMQVLANGIATLRENLLNINMWDEVVVMTYSEFGRRVAENGKQGTDHGTAAPHMILGGKVKGGFYGEQPSLTDLDDRGDMFYTTDFRDMYETIRTDWWGLNPLEGRQSLGFV